MTLIYSQSAYRAVLMSMDHTAFVVHTSTRVYTHKLQREASTSNQPSTGNKGSSWHKVADVPLKVFHTVQENYQLEPRPLLKAQSEQHPHSKEW